MRFYGHRECSIDFKTSAPGRGDHRQSRDELGHVVTVTGPINGFINEPQKFPLFCLLGRLPAAACDIIAHTHSLTQRGAAAAAAAGGETS